MDGILKYVEENDKLIPDHVFCFDGGIPDYDRFYITTSSKG